MSPAIIAGAVVSNGSGFAGGEFIALAGSRFAPYADRYLPQTRLYFSIVEVAFDIRDK